MNDDSENVYIPATKVRERYGGISDMSLWRWERNPEMGFPPSNHHQPTPILAAHRSGELGTLPAAESRRMTETVITDGLAIGMHQAATGALLHERRKTGSGRS